MLRRMEGFNVITVDGRLGTKKFFPTVPFDPDELSQNYFTMLLHLNVGPQVEAINHVGRTRRTTGSVKKSNKFRLFPLM